MNVRTYVYRNAKRVSTCRSDGKPAALSLAAAVFALSLAAPVAIDIDTGFAANSAHAGNHGGGNGGGNGGGGNGGGGNNGGGNAGAGSTGPGDSDGPGGRGSNSRGNRGASVDANIDRETDGALLLPPPQEEITMAMFTTRISKRYPADEITSLEDPHQAVSFFSELKDMAGKQITHMWYHDGELKFKASFKIRADQWRVWSTQLLPDSMPGDWKVEVVDMAGKVLVAEHLTYAPPPATVATN